MTRKARTDVSVIVLAKDLTAAKTRLGLERDHAEEVALQLVLRTVRVVIDARHVGSVSVVTSDPRISHTSARLGAGVIAEGRPRGINRAAALGIAHNLRVRPHAPVAIMVADLPLLRSQELDLVVDQFLADADVPLYVPDHHMTGTTFLIHSQHSRPGLAFGRQSALMHRRLGYRPVYRAPRGLRVDLDLPEDIQDYLARARGAECDGSIDVGRALRPMGDVAQSRPQVDSVPAMPHRGRVLASSTLKEM